MRRWLVQICVLLLLGAIVNVAVTWSLSMFSNLPDRRSIYGPELVGIMNTYGLHDDPAEERAIAEWKGPGRRAMPLFGDSKHHGRVPLNIRYVLQAGWPLVSLTATWSWERDSTGSESSLKWLEHCSGGVPTTARDALPASAPTVLRKQPRVLPLHPLWPGFVINTLFYAAILWLLFAAPFALRRWRRIKRGLCPKCAYPVGTSDVCTECGAVVKARAAT